MEVETFKVVGSSLVVECIIPHTPQAVEDGERISYSAHRLLGGPRE